MAMENGNIATDLEDRSSTLPYNPTASSSSTGTRESGTPLISTTSTRSAPMMARMESAARGGHSTPSEARMFGHPLQDSALPRSLPLLPSYERQSDRVHPLSASPPAPLDFYSYSMAMLQYTQTQLDATPDTPPPPSHIHVAGPISYRQRRSQAHYQQQQQQQQGRREQVHRHHNNSQQASPSDDSATTYAGDATASSDTI
ncbi:hypothetical protein CMQ_5981 [Grosmannia clavigera kw1407]|uniref:Uncharacterized protein n=1 Tax=Grosmannia clavigera (strain kw1407 / UAMH 11150) TaxID=655863 RepID=F0XLJ9_GROCL|nr:uncharacterized protein CMQ_5981 [Grosmannia clavigera kw1407]EFX01039.1 hypothetical protein CMQ_5981 [Grosmannia clavigera kw1407]